MKRLSGNWALATLALGAWSAHAEVDTEALKHIENYTKFVQESNTDILNALAAAEIDPADRSSIGRYYNGVRLEYLARPMSEFLGSGVPQAMSRYGSRVANALDEMRSGVVDTRKVLNCVEESSEMSLSEFRRAGQLAGRALDDLQTAISTPINMQNPTSGTYWSGAKDLAYSMKALSWDVGSAISSCCRKSNYLMRDATAEEQKTECDAVSESIDTAKSAFNASLASVSTPAYRLVPNPLSLPRLSSEDVALIVQDHASATRIAKARSSSNADVNEMDIFSEMSRCRSNVLSFQEKKNPIPKAVLTNVGKMLKCQVLPYIATNSWKTGNQRLAVAFGAAPIQGKDWDINCGQQEMANWAGMRSDDLAVIDQKWGIPQLENPPYTQGMANLPSYQSRYAMEGLEAADLAQMVPEATTATGYRTGGPGNLSAINSGGSPNTGARTGRSSSSRKLAFTLDQSGGSDGASASRAAGSMRGSFSRGTDRGLGLVQATRSAAAFVRKNERAEFYASRIQSGARNTRNFLASAGRRIRVTGAAEVSRQRTQEAATVAAYTSRATGARASRTTTEGILNQLQSSGAPKGKVRPVTTRERNDEERTVITSKIQGYLNNIEFAKKESDKANRKIQEMLVERQSTIDELRLEYKDEPDAKQADLVLEARRKIKQIDIELGALRMEYTTYQMEMLEQDGAIQRLLTFGELPSSSGGSGRGTQTGTSSTATLPDGYQAPASGRGQTGWVPQVIDFLNPIRSAWANVKAAIDLEAHWASEWDRFKREYADYAEGKRKVERGLAAEGAGLWAARRAAATVDGVYEVDTENLVTQDFFLREVVEESDHIISLERKRELKATPRAIASMRQAKADAEEARKLWIGHQKIWFESLPAKPEQNAEALWSLVPDFFLY
jgi:hypothetical protein